MVEALKIKDLIDVINQNKEKLDKARRMWSLYMYERNNLYIFGTKFDSDVPAYVKNTQQRVHHPFYLEIVDTKVDYLLGNGVTYMIASEEKEDVMKQMNRFDKINNTYDLEWEAATYSSACGFCGRLIYVSEGKELELQDNIKVINIPPWETIVEYDQNGDIEVAVRVYQSGDLYKIEQYHTGGVIFYEGESIEDIKQIKVQKDIFNQIPFFKISNNTEEMSDTERVKDLVDLYDVTTSNFFSELKGIRDAILTISGGATLDEETLEFMKKTGVMIIPGASGSENKIEVKWLIKEMPTKNFEVADENLRRSINQFSQHVDFSEETFAGNLTNFNITFKLMPLDIKASKYETKLTKGLDYQFNIVFDYWNTTMKTDMFDYFDLKYQFVRKKPRNKIEDAKEQQYLDGLISDDTRISFHPDIDDASAEMEKMTLEEEGKFRKEMEITDEG